MWTTFRVMLTGGLRDVNTLVQSVMLPLLMLIGLCYFFKDPVYRLQALLGVAAFSTIIYCMASAAFEVMKQRRQGVYKLLRATPFATSAFVASLTLARSVLAFVPTVMVFAVGILFYRIPIGMTGVVLLPIALAPAILCFTFLGVMVGNLASDEAQVNAMDNLIFLPMVLGSQAFYSLAGAPAWIQTASRYLPLSHFLEALKAAYTGDLTGMLSPLLPVTGFVAVTLVLAVGTFRWDHSAPVRFKLRFQ